MTIIVTISAVVIIILLILVISQFKRLNRQLKNAEIKVDQAKKLKSIFLSNINSRIKTLPKNEDTYYNTNDSATEESNINLNVKDSTHQDLLVNTISDVMEFSEIKSGFIEINNSGFNLHPIFAFLAHSYSQTIKNDLFIECVNENRCVVYSDSKRISQIMHTFIDTAINYTDDGKISIGYTVQDDSVKLYVEDSGIEINGEDFKKIFSSIQSAENDINTPDLNLSKAKAMAERLGGSIGFSSSDKNTACFWLLIPKKVEELNTPKTLPFNRPVSNKPLNILVAEDVDSNYRLIEVLLSGHNVERAVNGIEAVEKAGFNEYSVILMDIRMPEMDGVEATRQIREFNDYVPIIAITANAFDTDKDMAMKAGCNAFLTKPLSRQELEHYIPILDD